MKHTRTAVRFALAAAALLAVSAPLYAQVYMSDPNAAVACGAFQRWGNGNWTATAPSTLAFDNGTTIAVRPGQTFHPNQTFGGIEVSANIDRHCGNL